MFSVQNDNMLVIRTLDPLPLRVDNATAQKLWIKTADGTIGWYSVTQLRTGDYLFNAIDQRWTPVVRIEKAPAGTHIMYDIYTTAPYDYIANNYLDPPKIPGGGSLSSGPSVAGSTPSGVVASGYSFTYTYSGDALTTITYSDYYSISYAYDGLGRVSRVLGSPSTIASLTYYKNDLLNSTTYGNGLIQGYKYDNL